ncbi:MAG: hypothetical protein ACTSRU_07295 [Candidatus Hodarchaeales archaeon]
MTKKKLVKHFELLPRRCKLCFQPNEIWLDGTYGCQNGHVYAHEDGYVWYHGSGVES